MISNNFENKEPKKHPVRHIINWCVGNCLLNSDNSLKDNENYSDDVRKLVDDLNKEFKEKSMAHEEFFRS